MMAGEGSIYRNDGDKAVAANDPSYDPDYVFENSYQSVCKLIDTLDGAIRANDQQGVELDEAMKANRMKHEHLISFKHRALRARDAMAGNEPVEAEKLMTKFGVGSGGTIGRAVEGVTYNV